jgi:hypothetical protein
MKDEYAFVINIKVGQDMLTARADTAEDVIAAILDLKSKYEGSFGEQDRQVVNHFDDEPAQLSNCQQPTAHGLKYKKEGKKGPYCFECFKSIQMAKGLWKGR